MCEIVQDLRQTLPCDATAPGRARRLVRQAACPDHPADLDRALLLVSELVTNAVVHAGPPVLVSLCCTSRLLRLGVHDGDGLTRELRPSHPHASAAPEADAPDVGDTRHGTEAGGAPTDLDEHGRGLDLTAAVADRWWVDSTDTGKWVYAEIPALDTAA